MDFMNSYLSRRLLGHLGLEEIHLMLKLYCRAAREIIWSCYNGVSGSKLIPKIKIFQVFVAM